MPGAGVKPKRQIKPNGECTDHERAMLEAREQALKAVAVLDDALVDSGVLVEDDG